MAGISGEGDEVIARMHQLASEGWTYLMHSRPTLISWQLWVLSTTEYKQVLRITSQPRLLKARAVRCQY